MEYVNPQDYFYFISLFNSTVLDYFHKHISRIFNNKYYIHPKEYVDLWPIRTNLDKNVRNKLVKAAMSIQRLIREQTMIKDKLNNIESFLSNIPMKGRLINLAAGVTLNKETYKTDKFTIRPINTLEGKIEYSLILGLKDFLKFKNEDDAIFIYNYLRKWERLTKQMLLSLEVPSREDISNIVSHLKAANARQEILSKKIKYLQKYIDSLVANKVYLLNDAEISIINDFLEIF
jgi:hypothetical protein